MKLEIDKTISIFSINQLYLKSLKIIFKAGIIDKLLGGIIQFSSKIYAS